MPTISAAAYGIASVRTASCTFSLPYPGDSEAGSRTAISASSARVPIMGQPTSRESGGRPRGLRATATIEPSSIHAP